MRTTLCFVKPAGALQPCSTINRKGRYNSSGLLLTLHGINAFRGDAERLA